MTTLPDGREIIDEFCYCGHFKSSHRDSYPGIPGTEGHGSCKECDCEKFTWKEFLVAAK